MNTVENNKIIAEFMGLVKSSIENEYWTKKSIEGFGCGKLTELKYHSDWNWLMQVVEKIESLLPDDSVITIEYKDCYIPVLEDSFTIQGNGETKLQAVYNACLEFIKWYNEQKSA